VKRKSRTHSSRALRVNYSYSLEQIADLYDVDIATVRRWIRVDGLKRIPRVRPYLVHSSELKIFLEQRQKDRRRPGSLDEVYCLKCRIPRIPKMRSGVGELLPNRTTRFKAQCSVCECRIFKVIGRVKWTEMHPLAAYLQNAPAQHNGLLPVPHECPHGKGE